MKKILLILSVVTTLFSCQEKDSKESVKISNYVEKEDGTFSFTVTYLDKHLDDRFRTLDVNMTDNVGTVVEENFMTGEVAKYVYCK